MWLIDKLLGRNKWVITPVFDPKAEMQSKEGAEKYLSRISSLSPSDLCAELSNVLAAKHNLTMMPVRPDNYQKTQALVTDLTDKATVICMFAFGQQKVIDYGEGDTRKFNILLNELDSEIMMLDLKPQQHGEQLLKRLKEKLP